MPSPRILFWVQHVLGTGHLQRALTLARGLARGGFEVMLVSGGAPAPFPVAAGIRLVQLPPLTASSADFGRLVDETGKAAGETVWQARRERLMAQLESVAPHIVLTEMFPFGRSAFMRELEPLLDGARQRRPRPRIVASVRDVLVSKADPRSYERMRQRCERYYDLVLVHGDPGLVPFEASFPLADSLRTPLVHTGYLLEPAAQPAPTARSGVVVSAGGGAVGRDLIETSLTLGRVRASGKEPWTIILGSNTALDETALAHAAAGTALEIRRHVDDLPQRLARARVAISQAGYNTATETLAAGTPAVFVPFEAEGEDEQLKRARILAEKGRAVLLRQAALTPPNLEAAIAEASRLECDTGTLRLDGLARSVERLRRLVDEVAES